MKPRTLALLFALTPAACTDETTDPGAAEFRTSGPGCIGCVGNNSPRVNDYPFPELHLDGEANNDGVTLVGIVSPTNVLHTLDLVGDDFVARDGVGNIVATSYSLVGWKIALLPDDGPGQLIQIMAYDPYIPSWATGAAPISGYALAYQDSITGNHVNVCPDSGNNAADISVTLIGGETYDPELKRTNPGMTRWVTIACRDEAAYKMKRMNYGPNDTFGSTGQAASVAQRDATLKMITADYCGTGVSYTAQGTQLHWKNRSALVNTYPPFIALNKPPKIEARWTADGASCLSNTRYVDLDDVDCDIPTCPVNQITAHEWTTWVP